MQRAKIVLTSVLIFISTCLIIQLIVNLHRNAHENKESKNIDKVIYKSKEKTARNLKERKKVSGQKPFSLPKLKKSLMMERNGRIRQLFQNRTQRIAEVCEKYKSYMTRPGFFLPKAYSLEPYEQLAVCRTAKHGSTTWAKNFIHIYLG